MTINVAKLKGYMGAGMNIMITGPAGTGKTQMLKAAAKELKWNMKYYSASTLDPFADLIGIPVPDNENETMKYYRDASIDEADVIFFDEANRATDQTINSIFEITQFKSLNGKPLPNLKSVVIAINPVEDGYEGNDELDLAFVDRFDIYLESVVAADYGYFKDKYGTELARTGVSLFKEYQESFNADRKSKKNALGYLSPRRLEKIMDNYIKFPSAETITISTPANVTLGAKRWAEQFHTALNGAKAAPTAAAANLPNGGTEADITYQLKLQAADVRAANNVDKFKRAYAFAIKQDSSDGKTRKDSLLRALSVALSYGVGATTIDRKWRDVVQDFSPAHRQGMMADWPAKKIEEVEQLFGW